MGGRLLVVGTNTSTWGRSWASEQHVAMSQVNAAANGVWVVHGALSGISAFVDPQGHVVARSALWEATTLSHHVSFRRGETLYTRYGDWTAFASLALGGAAVVYGLARRAWARRRDTVA
jgi:apolipoprotein N-acyltransferase